LVIKWILIPLSSITGIFVIRAIGPQGKGVLTLLNSMVAIITVIASLGLSSSSTYLHKQKKYSVGTLIGSASLLWVVIFCILAAALFWNSEAFIKIVAGDTGDSVIQPIWLWLSLATLPSTLLLSIVYNILIVDDQMRVYGLVNVGGNLAGLALAWMLVIVFKWGVTGALLANVGVQCFVTAIALYWLVTYGEQGRIHISKTAFVQMVRIGYGTYFSSIVANIFKRGEVLVLMSLLDIKSIGYYGVALVFYELLIDIPRVVVWPMVGRLADPSNANQAKEASRSIRLQMLIMSVPVIAVALISPFVIPFVYGQVFAPAGMFLTCIVSGVIFRAIHLGVYAYFTAQGRAEATLPSVTVAAVVNLGLDIVLVPYFGLIGVAISNVIAEILMAVMSIIVFLKRSQGRWCDLFPPRKNDLLDLFRMSNVFVQKAIKKLSLISSA